MSASKPNESNEAAAASASLRRPAGSILAPSKLSFGIGGSSDKLAASSPLAASSVSSKLAFHGLKASKLESVAQAVCKAKDSSASLSTPTATKAASAPQKPSFIPLAKDDLANEQGKDSAVTGEAKEASEAEFVFGENLTDRVANFEQVVNGSTKSSEASHCSEASPNLEKPSKTKASEQTTTLTSPEKVKTLSESAAEYVESRSKKVDFSDVELITGEENEVNAFQMSAKLYIFEKSTSSWLERGRGQIRLNDRRTSHPNEEDSPILSSRLIMRTAGSLRVILNSKVFAGMTLEKPTDKNIRLTATDGNDGLKVFLVSGSSKDIAKMFQALFRRIESLKKNVAPESIEDEDNKDLQANVEHVALPAKRKLDETEKQEDKELQKPLEKEAKVD